MRKVHLPKTEHDVCMWKHLHMLFSLSNILQVPFRRESNYPLEMSPVCVAQLLAFMSGKWWAFLFSLFWLHIMPPSLSLHQPCLPLCSCLRIWHWFDLSLKVSSPKFCMTHSSLSLNFCSNAIFSERLFLIIGENVVNHKPIYFFLSIPIPVVFYYIVLIMFSCIM